MVKKQPQPQATTGGVTHATVSLDALHPHPRNYRNHPESQIGRLAASLARFGQVRSVVVQQGADGRYLIVAGHGLAEAAKREGYATLEADVVPAHWTDAQVTGYLVADNESSREAEDDLTQLAAMLEEQRAAGYHLESLGFSDDDLTTLLAQLADEALTPDSSDVERPNTQKPNPRQLPIDVIYTLQMADCTCCLAVQAGLKYGIQSASYRLCPYTHELSERHEVAFIDNDYFNYDHSIHLEAVRVLRPKYATVRDVMTKKQCREAGIDYYSLEQILTWADELAQYAENVIVIPKYDCVADIPEHFMLGYSIPTSHGGTPLSTDLFRQRRVHLLGGSWQQQLTYMADLGEAVVSVDNNSVQKLASQFGQCVLPDGRNVQLAEMGLGELTNPRYAALSISFGSIGANVQALYGASRKEELVS